MSSSEKSSHPSIPGHFLSETEAYEFVHDGLTKAGADRNSADAVARSLVGASLRGVDSHGIRLLPHYLEVLDKGRINGTPELTFHQHSPVAGLVDADNGFGHLAAYWAVDKAISIAEQVGLGMIAITNSSHLGAAGSYTLAAAEAGYIALLMSNSDKLVLAHDGVVPFHGTNPISFAAPVRNQQPYLVDMATSSIPLNKVLHYRSAGKPLPEDVAVDRHGSGTTDPEEVSALLPLGGKSFGYKGAAFAGICEILCSAISGMAFSHQLLAIHGQDMSTPRRLGHFLMVMKPDLFIPEEFYHQHLITYLDDLRSQAAVSDDVTVMAPGDREWKEQEKRKKDGIPIDSALWDELKNLSLRFGMELVHS